MGRETAESELDSTSVSQSRLFLVRLNWFGDDKALCVSFLKVIISLSSKAELGREF